MRRIATFGTRVTASPNPLRRQVRQYRARILQRGPRLVACRLWRCLRRKGERPLERARLKMYLDLAYLIPPVSCDVCDAPQSRGSWEGHLVGVAARLCEEVWIEWWRVAVGRRDQSHPLAHGY